VAPLGLRCKVFPIPARLRGYSLPCIITDNRADINGSSGGPMARRQFFMSRFVEMLEIK
jgi:hypothetical protein